jgi:hypothetical protein
MPHWQCHETEQRVTGWGPYTCAAQLTGHSTNTSSCNASESTKFKHTKRLDMTGTSTGGWRTGSSAAAAGELQKPHQISPRTMFGHNCGQSHSGAGAKSRKCEQSILSILQAYAEAQHLGLYTAAARILCTLCWASNPAAGLPQHYYTPCWQIASKGRC